MSRLSDSPPSLPSADSTYSVPRALGANARAGLIRTAEFFSFVGRRLLMALLVLPIIVFLSTFGLDSARGVPLGNALGHAATETPNYLLRLLHGDLGLTTAGSLNLLPRPISEVAPAALINSLGLLAVSLLLATVVGVGLGIWAATRRRSGWSTGVLLLSIVGISLPSFFAALLLQLAALRWLQIFGSALLPMGGFGWDAHLIMPALVLAARPVAQIFRITYVTLGDVLDQDFVRTARGKGLAAPLILTRHVMRNAAIPILTTVGLSLRFALSSLPVVEFFFGWPGAGFYLLKAIARQDDNLTIILVFALGFLFILVNVLLDAAYRLVDPRVQQRTLNKHRTGRRFWSWLRQLPADTINWMQDTPLGRRLQRRQEHPTILSLPPLPGQAAVPSSPDLTQSPRIRKQWLDLPLIAGAILVAALAVIFFFGPQLAPHSPFTTHGLTYVDGQFLVPPFAPDGVYPWGSDALGRDIMSLILAGAQQTLLLVTLVVVARLLIGLILGALAGWMSGGLLDRLVLGVAEVIAAFPTLLLAMILILTLGIRQGLSTFVIALCLIGWGEIMQLVRAEVLAIRPKPYIEGAVTIGLRATGILGKHVLPNLLPLLVSIAALEMGAVLMLLGELGFIGIFIGGGAFAELDIGAAPYHYSDVPEWGALLSNVRTYARGYPWIAVYPALAFFIAILGFNLFGEGLRRQVERGNIGLGWLTNRYTFALILVLILGVGWLRTNFGAVAIYRQQAALFDGETALDHVEYLADPALAGRGLGTLGMDQAADTIAAEFMEQGVQPAGEELTPFQVRRRGYQSVDVTPIFAVGDGGPAPVYRQDFAEYAGPARNLGQIAGPVQALLIGDLIESHSFGAISFPAFKGKDYSDDVLLLLSPADLQYLRRDVAYGGLLVVADEPSLLARRMTLSNLNPGYRLFTGEQVERDVPIFWISETLADRLLAGAQTSVSALRRQAETLEQDQILEVLTGVDVALSIQGTVHEDVTVRHVAGYLPGQSATLPGGGEAMDSQMIVVLAQYDSPPPGPEGVFPAANDNASGVAIMLEAIRTMQESGYQPYRTLLFVAYAGEGIEGGRDLSEPEAAEFLKGKYGFANNYTIEAVVRLRGLGAGSGDGLSISAGGSQRLAQLAETVAAQVGVATERTGEPMDIRVVFDEGSAFDSGQEAPDLTLSWTGWDETARTAGDQFGTIDITKLEQSGQVVSQLLMVLGREVQY